MRTLVRLVVIMSWVAATVGLGTADPAQARLDAAVEDEVRPVVAVGSKPPKIVGRPCRSENGVTVVVDFRTLRSPDGRKMNKIKIGCATGAQESGFTALLDAGFTVDPDNPFVCTIDDRPIDPPRCPPVDGYWAYSHGERGDGWEVAGTGAGGWAPPPGSLEGWSWAPYDKPGWVFPRVTPRDLFPPGSDPAHSPTVVSAG